MQAANEAAHATPWVTSDPVLFGLLLAILGLVFWSSSSERRFLQRFYAIVPSLLLCYFIPGLLNTVGVIDGSASQLYPVARDYLLPFALVVLTLSCDVKAIARLGPVAVGIFLVGTVAIVVGAPVALAIMGWFDPSLLAPDGADATWRGMTTLAGSWIGGSANQAAMKEVYEVGPDAFGKFVAVDAVWAYVWMAVLLMLAARATRLDAARGADTTALVALRERVERLQLEHARVASLGDIVGILAIGFAATGLSHALAGAITPWIEANAPGLAQYSLTSRFFWVTMLATTIGLALSFTRAKHLEGAGASKFGSAAIYVLVATIGMQMDLRAVFSDPELFALGGIWMAIHGGAMLLAAWLLRAPIFYMAVGSMANVGGAASAPIVAAAFHPALAPVGVLLAVLGYALGTYGGWLAGQLLRWYVGA
jgi:uncharacterized membrane protein